MIINTNIITIIVMNTPTTMRTAMMASHMRMNIRIPMPMSMIMNIRMRMRMRTAMTGTIMAMIMPVITGAMITIIRTMKTRRTIIPIDAFSIPDDTNDLTAEC